MDTLEQTCNEGNSTTIDFMNEEPADIASFLKKYLRDVPDRPLFTKELEPEVHFLSFPIFPSFF